MRDNPETMLCADIERELITIHGISAGLLVKFTREDLIELLEYMRSKEKTESSYV